MGHHLANEAVFGSLTLILMVPWFATVVVVAGHQGIRHQASRGSWDSFLNLILLPALRILTLIFAWALCGSLSCFFLVADPHPLLSLAGVRPEPEDRTTVAVALPNTPAAGKGGGSHRGNPTAEAAL